jgi:hypothetical protein
LVTLKGFGLKIANFWRLPWPKLTFMKKAPSLTLLISLCLSIIACKKSNGGTAPVSTYSTLSFSANDTSVSFPVDLVFIQDVLNTHTTLITGQYVDTSANPGNISIRVIGDTTGRYQGDSLLVTYTDKRGTVYYNDTKDSSNFASIDKFPKTADGMVSGSFFCKVIKGTDTVRFSKGIFIASFQD